MTVEKAADRIVLSSGQVPRGTENRLQAVRDVLPNWVGRQKVTGSQVTVRGSRLPETEYGCMVQSGIGRSAYIGEVVGSNPTTPIMLVPNRGEKYEVTTSGNQVSPHSE